MAVVRQRRDVGRDVRCDVRCDVGCDVGRPFQGRPRGPERPAPPSKAPAPHRFALLIALVMASACARTQPPDAYGNVEAIEVVVGAEAAGRLVAFTVTEGDMLQSGATVGAIDAVELTLQREQLVAQRNATASRIDEVRQQIAVLEAQRGAANAQRNAAVAQRDALASQLEIAKRAYDRTQRLIAEQAATSQQLDQAERDYRVLGDQIKAQNEQIRAQERQVAAQGDQIRTARAQEQTIRAQVASADAQVNQIAERIRKSDVRCPVAGTVLTTYAKAGEMVQLGQPLFRIADLAAVDVRAYVTEPQLANTHIGQEAIVTLDAGNGQRQTIAGKVTWISARAEFTPTPIQTRDERAELVYAVKIRTPNERGVLKIGMPVDVQFAGSRAAR
jgi:HlyD family secretion protein